MSFIPFYTFPLELGAIEMFNASTSFVLKNFGHLLPSVKCQADKHICFIKSIHIKHWYIFWIPFQCKYYHSRYRYFHDNNKMVMWPSYLYNGNPYAEKMVFLYWDGPLDVIHDDVIMWTQFLHYWSFVRRIHWTVVGSPHKRPAMQSFDAFFDVRQNKLLNKPKLSVIWGALTHCGLINILVNTGSGNGLLPDSTKPLPEPMLTYHQ